MWGVVALVSVAAGMGIFRRDAGSLVRAGWHTGMLGPGLILFIASRACSQSLMPQVLSWGRNRVAKCLAFAHFEVLSCQTLSS